jgi:hypothetical protein
MRQAASYQAPAQNYCCPGLLRPDLQPAIGLRKPQALDTSLSRRHSWLIGLGLLAQPSTSSMGDRRPTIFMFLYPLVRLARE